MSVTHKLIWRWKANRAPCNLALLYCLRARHWATCHFTRQHWSPEWIRSISVVHLTKCSHLNISATPVLTSPDSTSYHKGNYVISWKRAWIVWQHCKRVKQVGDSSQFTTYSIYKIGPPHVMFPRHSIFKTFFFLNSHFNICYDTFNKLLSNKKSISWESIDSWLTHWADSIHHNSKKWYISTPTLKPSASWKPRTA